MDENAALRENRLRLLNRFVAVFADVADFGKMAKKAQSSPHQWKKPGEWFRCAYGSCAQLPTIHVVSDSVGLTAQAVARAAAAQFGVTNPGIEVLPKVRKFEEVKRFLEEHSASCASVTPAMAESSSATPSSTRGCGRANGRVRRRSR